MWGLFHVCFGCALVSCNHMPSMDLVSFVLTVISCFLTHHFMSYVISFDVLNYCKTWLPPMGIINVIPLPPDEGCNKNLRVDPRVVDLPWHHESGGRGIIISVIASERTGWLMRDCMTGRDNAIEKTVWLIESCTTSSHIVMASLILWERYYGMSELNCNPP